MIESSCHCGAVSLQIDGVIGDVTDCNCSICRRYGALWAYFSPRLVQVVPPVGVTDIYMCGNKWLEFHRCKICGSVTHWSPVDKSVDRMGVNARLLHPAQLAQARIRRFDGADTWKSLDD